jgi:acyl carrier protein
MEVRQRLLRVFREALENSSIDERVSIQNCAAWDSLTHIKLLVAIEEEFGFEPSPDDIVKMFSDFSTMEEVISRRIDGQ